MSVKTSSNPHLKSGKQDSKDIAPHIVGIVTNINLNDIGIKVIERYSFETYGGRSQGAVRFAVRSEHLRHKDVGQRWVGML